MGYESGLHKFFREGELSKRIINRFGVSENPEKGYSGESEALTFFNKIGKGPILCDHCLLNADSLSNRKVNKVVPGTSVCSHHVPELLREKYPR